ncbi:polysaccharide biosynthesis protein, partial [Rodentibacter caecimuris]
MLYISRIVLEVLGVEDFGIYNLVMGVVVLFSFFNGTMTATTQRFINIEKASNQLESVRKIFNLSIINHIFIIITVILLAETIGLWFLNEKLNIPFEKIETANIIFQIALCITLVEIIKVPFEATIIAYEKMSFFAWLGIIESLAKLVAIYSLVYVPIQNKLIAYSFLLLLVSLFRFLIYIFYTKKYFKQETQFKFYKDFSKTKELLHFSGWMLFGQVAVVGATQGLNMVINLFFGVIANAAVGIANQVDAAVYSFINNFQIAFNPQLTQSYANKDYQRNQTLILSTSKYSFYLMGILSIPVLYFSHTLLTLWLGEHLPEHVEALVQVIILCSLINAMGGSFWITAMAIGGKSVKFYNIVLTIINLFTVPLAYYLFTLGYSPIYAFIGKFIINFIMQVFRVYFINKHIQFNRTELYSYLLNVLLIFSFIMTILYLSDTKRSYAFFEFLGQSILLEFILLILILILGINKKERIFLFTKL